MARQPQTWKIVVHEEARSLSEGDPVFKFEPALDRLVEAFAAALRDDPRALAKQFRSRPLNLLRDSLECMPSEQAISLIMSADLDDLADRVNFTEFFFDEKTPLLTVPELGERLRQFGGFLDENKEFMKRYGLPPRPFKENRWLYLKLARTYDTRTTTSPWPIFEYSRCLSDNAESYEWTQIDHDLGYSLRVCDYEHADYLPWLDRKKAVRLESLRERLFDAKRQIVGLLEIATRNSTPATVWDDCLAVLKEVLSATEVSFLLDMDTAYLRRNFVTPSGWKDDRENPGGLTDLLEVIGHIEKELSIGSLASARSHLGDKVLKRIRRKNKGFHEQLFLRSYDGPDRTPLDQALNAFLARRDQARAFDKEFQERVEKALHEQFPVIVRLPISPRYVQLVRPVLEQYAKHIQERRDAGHWYESPPQGLCVFRYDGPSWTIIFDGIVRGMPDTQGLFHLSLLLQHAGREISPEGLRRAYVKWKKDLSQSILATFRTAETEYSEALSTNSDLGEIVDPETLENVKRERNKVQQQLDQLRDSADQEQRAQLEQKKKMLDDYLRDSKNIHGRPRRSRSRSQLNVQAVTKTIRETLLKLKKAHPALHKHLEPSIELGEKCRYLPDPEISWQF